MKSYRVIIPTELKPSPARYEVSAATLLANYFKADVEFVVRSNHKTPDFLINDVAWELKSPTGNGKRNIQRQLQTGMKQSRNIVFDARRSKIHIARIKHILNYQFHTTKSLERMLLIDKNKNVIELTK